MHVSCMATKTITLELDAYEHLRSRKRPGESFSAVVRRARFERSAPTGNELHKYFSEGGSGLDEVYWEGVVKASANDTPPEDPWA
jgi:hypothetical protein